MKKPVRPGSGGLFVVRVESDGKVPPNSTISAFKLFILDFAKYGLFLTSSPPRSKYPIDVN